MHEDSIVSGIKNTLFKNEDLIVGGQLRKLPKHATVPFAWPYRLNRTKDLAIKLGNSIHKVQVDHDLKKAEYPSSEPNGPVFIVEVLVTANSKKVKITLKQEGE